MSIALVSDLIFTHGMNLNNMVADLIFQTVCGSQGSCETLPVVADLKI